MKTEYVVHSNTIKTLLEERGFNWDDYLFLLNNQIVYETLEKLNSVEWLYDYNQEVPSVVYNKNNVLNAVFLEREQFSFLIENKLIDEKEWNMVGLYEYQNLIFKDKSLEYFTKLQSFISNIWDYRALRIFKGNEYNQENFMDFFKTNLNNITLLYTDFFGRISVQYYDVIK